MKKSKYIIKKAQVGAVAPRREDFGDNEEAYIQALEEYILSLNQGEDEPFFPNIQRPEKRTSSFADTNKVINEKLPMTRDLSSPSETMTTKGPGLSFSRLKLSGTGGIDDIFNLAEGIKNIGNGDKGNGLGKAFGIINPAARIITNTANKLGDIRNRRKEIEQYVKAMQEPAFDSTIEEGLNPNPIYVQYGGNTPIYTSNPNDPRLRAYQDSLKVYNNYEKFRAAMKSKDFTNSDNAEDYYIEVFNKYLKPLWPLTLGKGKRTIEPIFIPAGNIKPANSNKRTGFPFYDNYKGVKPVQPVIYQPEPKIDAPKKRKTSYSRDLSIVPIEAAEPNISQSLYDSNKPTKWSFTYPTGKNNEQETIYFPDQKMWKSFIQNQRLMNSQETSEQGSSTGYLKNGGFVENNGVTMNDNPIVEAEEGEVFTTGSGEIQKVAEGAGTHEEGGVLLNDVERVLEDTSDKRKDKISKALKVDPMMAKILAEVETNVPLSHSKVMEKAKEQQSKQLDKIQKTLQKNVKSLEKIPNNKYAKMSMDMNIQNLLDIPSEGEIFDNLFDHQELVKAMLGYGHSPKAKCGGKYKMKKAQIGDDVRKAAKELTDVSGWTLLGDDGNKTYYKKESGEVVAVPGSKKPVTRGGTNFTAQDMISNPNRYKTFHNLMTGATEAEKLAAAEKVVKEGVWPTQYKPSSSIDYGFVQWPTISLNDPTSPLVTGDAISNDEGVNIQEPITPSGSKSLNLTGQPKSRFFEPLRWFDVAGPMMGLMEGRIPVKHNPAQLNQIRLKQQNPLPLLQNAQGDFNALLRMVQNNPGGMAIANMAQAFAKKYGIDNQVLGQFENINSEIKNKELTYNAGIRDKQSLMDQAAREVTENKYLRSLEAQRQQKTKSWNDLFTTLAQNRKLNREGNLLMQLFPAFDQFGQYNQYKYTFRNPLSVKNS